ncbi:MAG: oligosaccharide repeat unit polymerase [Oligoflexia bacterium]|nr:oligosaccharide repeat unit polymerase [Oligoflexia bacterium]
MSALSIFIIFSTLIVSIYISYQKFKDILNPFLILSCWWGGCALLANLSLTGINAPSLHTSILVSMMILFFTLGGVVNIPWFKSKINIGIEREEIEEAEKIEEQRVKKILKIIFIIITPIIFFYFFRALNIFYTQGIENYRMLVFGTKENPSILFRSGPIELLYYLLIYSLIFYSLLASIALYFQSNLHNNLQNNRKDGTLFYLLYAIFLSFLDAIMRLGRFNIYHALILVGLILIYKFRKEQTHKKNKKIKILVPALVLSIFILSMVGVGYFRDKDKKDLFSQFKIYLIEYHTVGFAIFDQELQDKNSYLQTHISYGRATLGGVDQLVGLVARKIGFKNFSAPVQEIAFNMQTPRVIGNRGKAEFDCANSDCPIRYNAFSTILYTFYLDARDFAFVIMPFILGLLMAIFYRKMMEKKSIHSTIMFLIIFFVIFFSIFQSQIEAPATWLAVFINIFLLGKFKKKNLY